MMSAATSAAGGTNVSSVVAHKFSGRKPITIISRQAGLTRELLPLPKTWINRQPWAANMKRSMVIRKAGTRALCTQSAQTPSWVMATDFSLAKT